MPATREFHLGDVLSITTGRMVSPRGMCGIRDILEFMTKSTGMTDTGALFCKDSCTKALLLQHPRLATIADDPAERLPDEWLGQRVAEFGETLAVSPLDHEDANRRNPN